MTLRKTFLIIAIALIIFPTITFAGITGKLSGRVTDKSTGEPLPGANVLIVGTTIGASTDADGYFTLINIQPGEYSIRFGFVGYANLKIESVIVNADRTTKVDAQLTTSDIALNEVVVKAERPPIEKDRTYSASIVNSSTISSMPVTSVSEVLQLQPGVVNSGGTLHFRGGRGREVAYLIDGIPVTDAFNQSGGNNVNIENGMIEELEVISGTFNAEYGAAQSGIVNIITKGTGRNWTGSVRSYIGDWLRSGSDVFIGTSEFDPVNDKDIQFNLSGPIIADKIGISISGRYNSSKSLEWYERRFNPTDGWRIAAYQRWFQEQRGEQSSETQAVYIPDSLMTGDRTHGPLAQFLNTSYNAKLNYYPVPEINFTYQLFGGFDKTEGTTDASRRYQPDEAGVSKSWTLHHFFTVRHSPSDKFFYSIGLSFQRNTGESYYNKENKIAQYPGDTGIQPVGYSANGFSLGNTGGFYTGAEGKNYRNLYLANANFNWQIDKYNFVKAGFEIKQHEINTYNWGYTETKEWETYKWLNFERDPDLSFDEYWNIMVDYWKNWETIYDTTKYRKYSKDEYANWRDYTIRPFEFAAFIQDKVELGEIIINAGLRLDIFKPNEKVPVNYRTESYNLGRESNLVDAKTKYQFSPRLGVSFPISQRGVFHAAYGHFFQMPSFSKMYNEPLYALTPIQLEGRLLGNTDLEPEKTVQYEIGLQQQLTEDIAVDITAFYKDFKNLLGKEKVTTVDAVGYERYINRDYGNTTGITVGLRKTSGLVTGALNYSFSYANGSSSDPDALRLIQASTQIGGDPITFVDRRILPLSWDQRHTLNLIVSIAEERNWSVGFVSYVNSGQPYDPTFIERYDIPEREYLKSALKPLRWSVDLKAKKYLQIAGTDFVVFLKVDNLFDKLNENDVYSNSGTAKYNVRLPETERLERERLEQENLFTLEEIDNRPQWYSAPRKIEFGIEINF